MKDWKLWLAKHGANAVPDLGKEKATQLYRDGLRALTTLSQNAHSKAKNWKLGKLNHVAITPPDLKKATQLYQDGLEALTALSQDLYSKTKNWKLGKPNHIAIAAPDLKKAMQLYRDMLEASGSMLTTLSQDIKSKAKDGQLNITIVALLLSLGVDISGMEVSHILGLTALAIYCLTDMRLQTTWVGCTATCNIPLPLATSHYQSCLLLDSQNCMAFNNKTKVVAIKSHSLVVSLR